MGLVVLCHGLGERSYIIKNLTQALLTDDFAVVHCDYYKHGYLVQYSRQGVYIELLIYGVDTCIDQLEDILRYVLDERKEEFVPIEGLLTGGLLSIKAVALITI